MHICDPTLPQNFSRSASAARAWRWQVGAHHPLRNRVIVHEGIHALLHLTVKGFQGFRPLLSIAVDGLKQGRCLLAYQRIRR